MSQTIHAFYKFVALPDYRELRAPLLQCCEDAGLVGSILLAEEGINATVAGSPAGLDALWSFLRADLRFADIEPKVSTAADEAFLRMKVRLKKEIVTMGVPDMDPRRRVGTYVPPEEWNALIARDDVCVIDTRNRYEVEVGTFEGAIDPAIDSFRDFPAYVDTHLDPERQARVAMFCTGGIRCEKATSYLLKKGFKDVFHLEGGILKYLEKIDPEESAWRGECFVFDQRVAVDHDLSPGHFGICHGCRHPLSEDDCASPDYEPGVVCPHCAPERDERQRQSARERHRQVGLATARQQRHLGPKAQPS